VVGYLDRLDEVADRFVVAERLRHELASVETGSETGTAVNLAPLHMTVSTPRMAISLGEPNVHA
jgi:hypothetical protein